MIITKLGNHIDIGEAHLKLKPKKCHFFQSQVSFLGHIVSEDGISTDPAKVQKIMDCPPLKDVHEVRMPSILSN